MQKESPTQAFLLQKITELKVNNKHKKPGSVSYTSEFRRTIMQALKQGVPKRDVVEASGVAKCSPQLWNEDGSIKKDSKKSKLSKLKIVENEDLLPPVVPVVEEPVIGQVCIGEKVKINIDIHNITTEFLVKIMNTERLSC